MDLGGARSRSGRPRRPTVVVAGAATLAALITGAILLQGLLDESGPYESTVAVTDDLDVLVVVDPGTVGRNTIHLYLLDARGHPSTRAEAIELLLTRLGRTEEPSRIHPFPAGPGHWVASTVIGQPGPWRLDVVPELDVGGSSRASLRLDIE